MSVINNNLLLTAAAGGATAGRSVRFNSADSAYLSRTPASAGNRKTWTWSGWVKRTKLSTTNQALFYSYASADNAGYTGILFSSGDELRVVGFTTTYRVTTQLFRDPSAWYHVVVAFDTTQATAANRIKVYVNGSEITTFSTSNNPTQNQDLGVNTAAPHALGYNIWSGGQLLDGYLALVHLIDGQALTPSSFGETSATTGQWIAKTYSGSYGTNGFFLDFSDNSAATATTLGKDSSGLGNNWVPNNLSVTAGSGNDSLRDHPTSAGTSTGLGGEVSGNYCTLNPLANPSGATLSNGNLDWSSTAAQNGACAGTIYVSSGKWYWEVTDNSGANALYIGITKSDDNLAASPGTTPGGYYYIDIGSAYTYNNNNLVSYGSTWASGDVIGVALNMDAGTLVFYKNGVSQGTAFTGLSGAFAPSFGDGGSSTAAAATLNAGQRAFAYTAPSGFSPLVDTLLPTPTIAKPNTVMDVKLYTGNGGTPQTISGLNFEADLLWFANRTTAGYLNPIIDQVRGLNKYLTPYATNAESTNANMVTATSSTGFTVGSSPQVNDTSQAMVTWLWDAGTSTVTNTQGSITSSVRANASAGFSIVTYTGSGSAATVGHGLAVPGLIIVKDRTSGSYNWQVYHKTFAGTSNTIVLNATYAVDTGGGGVWNSTTPTSTVFSIGTSVGVNTNGNNYVAYVWSPVAGYSSMGSYVGNGSSDGPAVWLGFRPKWLLIKRTDSANDWYLQDSARDPYNPCPAGLFPNLSAAEDSSYRSAYPNDMLSNGFKLRTSNAGWNASGGTYLYIAFAESPFQYARAR